MRFSFPCVLVIYLAKMIIGQSSVKLLCEVIFSNYSVSSRHLFTKSAVICSVCCCSWISNYFTSGLSQQNFKKFVYCHLIYKWFISKNYFCLNNLRFCYESSQVELSFFDSTNQGEKFMFTWKRKDCNE